MQSFIKYPNEEYISSHPTGAVFAIEKTLQVKIDNKYLMVLGTGEKNEFTKYCKAYPVRELKANI